MATPRRPFLSTSRRAMVVADDLKVGNQVAARLTDPSVGAFDMDSDAVVVAPTARDLRQRLHVFCANLHPSDVAFLYISGAVLIDRFGDGFLLTDDSHHDHPVSTMYELSAIDKAVRASPCTRLIVVIDVDTRTELAAGGLTGRNPAGNLANSFKPDDGKYVLLMSRDGSVHPYRSAKWRNAEVLLLGLEGAADANGDGLVTIDELFEYLSVQVTDGGRAPSPVRVVLGPSKEAINVGRASDGPGIDEDSQQLAGAQDRIFARLIDLIAVVLLSAPAHLLINPPAGETGIGETPFDSILVGDSVYNPATNQAITWTLLWIHLIAYEVVCFARWQRSLGKKVLDLEISTPAGPVSRFRTSALRASLLAIAGVLAVLEAWRPSRLGNTFLEASMPEMMIEAPVLLFPSLIILFGLLNLILVAAGQRTLWDRLARTRVVKVAR